MEFVLSREDVTTISMVSRLCRQPKIPRDMEVEILTYLIYMMVDDKYKYKLMARYNKKLEIVNRYIEIPRIREILHAINRHIMFKKECEISMDLDGYKIKMKDYEDILYTHRESMNINQGWFHLKIPEPISFIFVLNKN